MIERSRLLHFKGEILNFYKKKKKLSETILGSNFNHVKNAIFSNFLWLAHCAVFSKKKIPSQGMLINILPLKL